MAAGPKAALGPGPGLGLGLGLGLATGLAVIVAGATPAVAQRRVTVSPYIELGQILDADLDGGDVLTYSQVAAGIDASISGRRAEGQVSYRYERRIGWEGDVGNSDVHSGLARAAVRVAPGLSIEGGALATRTRNDIGGAAPVLLGGDYDNISQLYAVYAGPTLSTSAGPVNIGGSYRYGYTKVEVPDGGTGLSNGSGTGAVRRRRDFYDSSTGHVLQATAGIAAGAVLPVGVTVSGAYDREDAGQLDQRYQGSYGRGDVVLPVSRTLALQAGAGYEKITTSQRAALLTPTGVPALDDAGRYVTDRNAPRRIAYRTDGIFYDAGVIWRPNRRIELNARVGERYGSFTTVGSLTWQMTATSGVQVGVYDAVQTFGRQLRTGLANLPTSFVNRADPFGPQFAGCTFGTAGDAPGGCLDDAFQSVLTSSYRARGIDGIYTNTRGRTTFGLGAGYANRRLHTRDVPLGIQIYGLEDESWYGQAFWSRSLSAVSAVDVNLFANYYDSGTIDGVLSLGATGSYSHSFGRLGTIASLGIYTSDGGLADADTALQALLGARYQF